jgi:hypothetical protein
MPPFVENHPRLKEVWIQKWETLIKNSFDIKDVNDIENKNLKIE